MQYITCRKRGHKPFSVNEFFTHYKNKSLFFLFFLFITANSHFRHILNFLRTGSVVTLPSKEVEKQELALEADFYGLDALVKAIRLPKIDISEHLSEEILDQREKESALRVAFCSSGQQQKDLYQGLIPIFCPDDGIALPLKYDPDSPARRNQDFLFLKDASKKRTALAAEGDDPARPLVCVESIEAFRTNFNREWPNILHRIEQIFVQERVIIAGGSVLRALTASNNIRTGGDLWGGKISDIDIFLYAKEPEEANRISKRIWDALAVDNETWVVIRSRGVINIHRFRDDVVDAKVQIVLRLYDSPTEVLVGFDVDCCLCAYDGRNVWLAPRCVSALVSGTNVLNPLHAWPNRASYELRLAKYAVRGFAVLVPGIDKRRIDYSSFQKSRLADDNLKGLARFIKITTEMESARPFKRHEWHHHVRTTIERPRTAREISHLREVEEKIITEDEWLVDAWFDSPYDDVDNVVIPSVYHGGDTSCFAWMTGDFATASATREEAWPEILDAGEDGPTGVPRRLVDSWDTGKRSREYLNGKMDKFDLDNLYYSHAYGEQETNTTASN
jgi:BTB/POZ domain